MNMNILCNINRLRNMTKDKTTSRYDGRRFNEPPVLPGRVCTENCAWKTLAKQNRGFTTEMILQLRKVAICASKLSGIALFG